VIFIIPGSSSPIIISAFSLYQNNSTETVQMAPRQSAARKETTKTSRKRDAEEDMVNPPPRRMKAPITKADKPLSEESSARYERADAKAYSEHRFYYQT
jgi:hypothetical protein